MEASKEETAKTETKKPKKTKKPTNEPAFEIVVKVDGQIQSFSEQPETDDASVDIPSKIEAEDTLNMIKQALKGKKSKGTKKKAKKGDKPTPKLDAVSRFFNDYGESPHL